MKQATIHSENVSQGTVYEKARTQELITISAPDAWQLCQQNSKALLIDVRTSMEYLFVGHPQGAFHIPLVDDECSVSDDAAMNKNFVNDIAKLVSDYSMASDAVFIILICLCGKRSIEAGRLLIESGMKNIYIVEEGFEGQLNDDYRRSTVSGWRYHQLPWEQC